MAGIGQTTRDQPEVSSVRRAQRRMSQSPVKEICFKLFNGQGVSDQEELEGK
jgi:hypothetical protein